MATQLTNYQCPACTGPLHYDGASGKLVCDYCGSAYDTADVEELYAEKNAAAESAAQTREAPPSDSVWSENEATGLRSYSCPSCGAELICDETTAATSCPYCGNPTVIGGQFSGSQKPELVLPFVLDKSAAKSALKAFYKGKKFLPNAFKSQNHIEEIKGVYVPFWLFDADAEGEGHYEGLRSEEHREGDYVVTTTEHFDVFRAGSTQFRKVPVNASTKMPDGHMDAIEPFDYQNLQPFSAAFLPGYLADRYDVDADTSSVRARQRMENTVRDELLATINSYTGVNDLGENLNVQMTGTRYALLPVWMLHTKWHGKDFLFAMNGQTGKLVGDLPVDKTKVLAWFAGISLPLMLLLAFLL